MRNTALRTFMAAAILVLSAPVFALPQRVFVASRGLDTNPCSITQPCRGFATAIAVVAQAGEVIVLDSAGYGPVTINTAVSLTIVEADLSDIAQVGVHIDPVVPGSVVNASATRVTSSHNGGQGFSVFTNNVATATLAAIDSVGNDNGGVGISVSGTNAIAVVSGSSFVGNTSFDLFAGTGGVLRTSVNNSVTGRGAADISGALTTNSLK
jgi:nitrous oxidase accessory protein NosD